MGWGEDWIDVLLVMCFLDFLDGTFATEESRMGLVEGLGGARWKWGISLLLLRLRVLSVFAWKRSSPSAGRQHMRVFRCCRYVVCRMCSCFKCEGMWD